MVRVDAIDQNLLQRLLHAALEQDALIAPIGIELDQEGEQVE